MNRFVKWIAAWSLLVTAVGVYAAPDGQPEPSGLVEHGLRWLSVPAGSGELNYTLYRGDYIVFQFADGAQHQFNVPELGIKQLMPKPASEKPYVKIKRSGQFDFTLGQHKGRLNVLELLAKQYQELTAFESARLLENKPEIILIDVRTPGEFKAGHIAGAKLLPVQMFAANMSQLKQYQDQPILVYCASGNRSTVAAKMLLDAGFTEVYNMRHGIADWRHSKLPLE